VRLVIGPQPTLVLSAARDLGVPAEPVAAWLAGPADDVPTGIRADDPARLAGPGWWLNVREPDLVMLAGWREAGWPMPERLTVRAYPRATAPLPDPAALSVEKRSCRLVFELPV